MIEARHPQVDFRPLLAYGQLSDPDLMALSTPRSVDRLDPNDLPNLVSEQPGRSWTIAALLIIDRGPLIGSSGAVDVEGFSHSIEARIAMMPRLRQVLRCPRLGLGLPYWSDDRNFDIRRHVEVIRLGADLDWATAVQSTEQILERPLDLSRPLWKMYLIDGTGGEHVALVIVLHHVLADGIGGLAVLAGLVGPDPNAPAAWFARPGPTRGALLVDNLHRWISGGRALGRVLLHLASLLATLRAAYRDMWKEPAAITTFNTPIGSRRRLLTANVRLQAVKDTAHARGATVNDVALAAISAAMASLFTARNEVCNGTLQVSVPVSLRKEASTAELGNQVSGMRIPLPVGVADPFERLAQIARFTVTERDKKADPQRIRLFQGFWRALAGLRLHNWFVRRQRIVNLYATNVAGPKEPIQLLDSQVRAIVPIPPLGGNIPIGFGVFSYAETCTIAIVVDPDLVPDATSLLTGLSSALEDLTGAEVTMEPPRLAQLRGDGTP